MHRTYRVITLTDVRPERDTPHRHRSPHMTRDRAMRQAAHMVRLREEQDLPAHVIVGAYDSRGDYMMPVWEDFTTTV